LVLPSKRRGSSLAFWTTNHQYPNPCYIVGQPLFPGGPILLPFDYRSWGLGARGGRLLGQKGMLKDTYLRGELTWIFARKYSFPPYHGIQLGLSVSKNILLSKK